MNEIIKSLLSPAIIIAAFTLIIQGVFSIINSIHSKKAYKINFVISLFQFIDGLPIDDATKSIEKINIAKKLLPEEIPLSTKKIISHF